EAPERKFRGLSAREKGKIGTDCFVQKADMVVHGKWIFAVLYWLYPKEPKKKLRKGELNEKETCASSGGCHDREPACLLR
ncbi:MAG: hypothetical protein RR281_00980, partial [Pseudoflavonifractor sp.]